MERLNENYVKENKYIIAVAMIVLVAVFMGLGARMRKTDIQGLSTFDLEITYTNGETRTISGEPGLMELFRQATPLTVVDDTGRAIEDISFVAKIKVNYEGTANQADVWGVVSTYVNDQPVSERSYDLDYTNTRRLPNGDWIRTMTGSFSKYALDDWGNKGQNTLRIIHTVNVDVLFEDGKTDSKDGQGGAVMTYNIEDTQTTSTSGITALSATIKPDILY